MEGRPPPPRSGVGRELVRARPARRARWGRRRRGRRRRRRRRRRRSSAPVDRHDREREGRQLNDRHADAVVAGVAHVRVQRPVSPRVRVPRRQLSHARPAAHVVAAVDGRRRVERLAAAQPHRAEHRLAAAVDRNDRLCDRRAAARCGDSVTKKPLGRRPAARLAVGVEEFAKAATSATLPCRGRMYVTSAHRCSGYLVGGRCAGRK